VTLTIPGPSVTQSGMKALWARWRKGCEARGWGCVWRLELQTRTRIQPHWHCMVAAGAEPTLRGMGATSKEIRDLWLQSLGLHRAQVAGAREHAVDISWHAEIEWLWYRYLVDHASKSGGAQEAVGWGRHWGVVNRAAFDLVPPSRVNHLTPRQYARIRRTVAASQRWRIPDVRCPFGSRKSRASRRGSWGVSTWFGRAGTHQRIVAWAEAADDPESG